MFKQQLDKMCDESHEKFLKFSPQIGGDRETNLFEFRVIAHVQTRQSGKTTTLGKIYKPDHLYVTFGKLLIDNFQYYTEEKITYLNLESRDYTKQFQNILTRQPNIKRVYIDIGARGLLKRGAKVHSFIKQFDAILPDDVTPIYLIT